MPDAPAVLSWLWQASWHAAVVVGLVLVARLAIGRAVPLRWRHALWVIVLCRLAMPVAPDSRASVFNLWRHVEPTQQLVIMATTPAPLEHSWRRVADDPDVLVDVPAPPAPAVPRWPAVLLIAWLAVAAGLVGRLIVATVRFERRLARTGRPAGPALAATFAEACRQMRRRPRLLITDAVATPAVCGVLRPRVLVPTALADTLAGERARLVFLHELAHVRCHDVAVDWAWAIVRSVHWFNPAVWLVSPLRRHDRELARDEMVLSVAGPAAAEAYGRALLELATSARPRPMCPGLIGMFDRGDGGQLRQRVEAVARFRRGRAVAVALGVVVLAVLAVCLLTSPATNRRRQPEPDNRQTVESLIQSARQYQEQGQYRQASAAVDQILRVDPTNQYALGTRQLLLNRAKAPTAVVPYSDNTAYVDPDALSPADATTIAGLDRRLPEIRFNANALSDVIDFLRDTTNANIYVDWAALKVAGVGKETPVTARLRDIKFGKALELIFKSVEKDDDANQLGYTVDAGVLTITTRRELNKNTVTRRYDINDLLFIPPDYSSTTDKPATVKREERIKEVVRYIEQNVAPNSWKDAGGDVGSISTSPLRAIILITQTPENQAKIRGVLDSLRASQALQVSIEARIVAVDLADVPRVLANVRPAPVPSKPSQRGTLLSKADADAVVARAGSWSMTAPRLTLFSGQRSALSAMTDQAYVSGYTTLARRGGVTAYEPITRTVSCGLNYVVQATVSPDRQYVYVDLEPTVTRLAGLVVEPWAGAPAAGNVQRPVVLTSALRTACSIPDGATMLFSCGGFAPDATEPAVTDPTVATAVERARATQVFLLVRPTVLIQTSQKTFPLLEKPGR
jgi:beta-lactamase regulating signal transducer with metallopeptidase domain